MENSEAVSSKDAPGTGGYRYEKDLIFYLNKNNNIPAGMNQPAGTDDSIPDITIQSKGNESGVEVKLSDNVPFGSGTIGFDYLKFSADLNPWFMKESKKEAGQFISEMADQVNLIEEVNKKWFYKNSKIDYYVPYKIEEQRQYFKGKNLPEKRIQYETDKKNLNDIYISCPVINISNYYIRKKSYYVQIGNKGLFWFGGPDPLNLKNILPKYNPIEAQFRIRVQYKTSTNYRYAYELYGKGLQKSPYSLGDARMSGDNRYISLIETPINFL
jgi:hypothetical protein